MRDDGTYDYVYDSNVRSTLNGYNLLRHAATTMELYRFVETEFDDGSLHVLAARTIPYLLRRIVSVTRSGQDCACVTSSDVAKLGGTALTLLALATRVLQHRGDGDDTQLISRLARYVVSMQLPDGRFVSKEIVSTNTPMPFESGYYPGEAILALCFAFRVTKEASYLAHAIRGAVALLEKPPTGTNLGGRMTDHWLMKSLAELHVLAPDFIWARQLRRMSSGLLMLPTATVDGTLVPHWLIASSTTGLATRSEGLIASLKTELLLNNLALAGRISSFIRVGLTLCLERQFDTSSDVCPDRQADGGFSQALGEKQIRIDYVHHPLGAMLSFLACAEQMRAGAVDNTSCEETSHRARPWLGAAEILRAIDV